MKTPPRLSFVYFFWGVMLIICSCGPNPRSSQNPPVTADTEGTFYVGGMVCPTCADTVMGVLNGQPGISEVRAQYRNPESEVSVRFDSAQTDAQKIRALINTYYPVIRHVTKSIKT